MRYDRGMKGFVSKNTAAVIAGWTLTKFDYNHPGAQFGTHLFEFRNHERLIKISNLYWSGDKMPVMYSGRWIPCPRELRTFGDRHSKVIYELVPLAEKPEG